ncbi:hypothetical protein BCR34DRAFT_6023 [Clohesyomyces aquaticus]|uniref:Uncharacterized protein n=1 Tax=Clohesyomyces aquaticus TaxID=1231657 RepID=A0A1Y2ABH2_9PLEO|nr:hypothetical protein BCR34DRAFT_6023 [Clohesyomyces aquaticus]
MNMLRFVFSRAPDRPTRGTTRTGHTSTRRHRVEKRDSIKHRSSASSGEESNLDGHLRLGYQRRTAARSTSARDHRPKTYHSRRRISNDYLLDQIEQLADAIENNTRASLVRQNQLLRLVERLRTQVELGHHSDSVEPSLPSTRHWSPSEEDAQEQQDSVPYTRTQAGTGFNSAEPLRSTQDLPRFPSGFPQAPAYAGPMPPPFMPRNNQLRAPDRREPHDLPDVLEQS